MWLHASHGLEAVLKVHKHVSVCGVMTQMPLEDLP